MALLGIVQRMTRSLGLDVPSAVVGNTDSQIIQILELLNEEGEDLAARGQWEAMVVNNTFTQAAAALQGAMNSDICTNGDFDYIVNDTMWNRTTQLPILGPLSSQDWQTLEAFPVTGPYQQFKIRGGKLYFDPVGANATDTIAFEYMSTSWCESSGGTGQSTWAADTDVGRLDENLMRLGLIWRWKKQKGLAYAEDFNTYERRVKQALGRDGGAPRLSLSGGIRHRIPGVMVPLGSWSVS